MFKLALWNSLKILWRKKKQKDLLEMNLTKDKPYNKEYLNKDKLVGGAH